MTRSEAKRYWLKSADQCVIVANDNFKLKHYSWSLFFWQMAIEKLLKGLIVSRGKAPVYTHRLDQLLSQAGLEIDVKMKNNLKEITSFNLEARYDDYKLSFYKKATLSYTRKWIKICEEVYQWLKRLF